MKTPMRLLIAATFLVGSGVLAFAGNVKVIVNPSVRTDSISPEELRAVFLLQRRTLKDGSSVIPVLQKGGATHEAFLREFLNRESEELRTYYQGLVFTGKGSMPKELNSDSEVVNYVALTKGTMGYVSSSANTEGVKVLVVFPSGRSGDRTLLTRVEPVYPEALKMRGISGTVRLELTISPKGSVDNVAVLGGNPILAEAAVTAVKQWVYSPWPAPTTVQVSIPF
jgi:TonB family protein